MGNQGNRYDALRAQARGLQARAARPISAALERLRARLRGRPVRNYGSRLRRP